MSPNCVRGPGCGLICTFAYPGASGRTPPRNHGMTNDGDADQMCENERFGCASSRGDHQFVDQHGN